MLFKSNHICTLFMYYKHICKAYEQCTLYTCKYIITLYYVICITHKTLEAYISEFVIYTIYKVWKIPQFERELIILCT